MELYKIIIYNNKKVYNVTASSFGKAERKLLDYLELIEEDNNRIEAITIDTNSTTI